jgi:hypothetical protein
MYRIRHGIGARAACLGVLLGLSALAARAEGRCLTERERAAFDVRILQTELMVGALACRGAQDGDFPGRYAAFVDANRAALKSHADALRAHFRRSFGRGAEAELDRFVTSLANDLSHASMTGAERYCAQQQGLFERAARTAPTELGRLATERAAAHPVPAPACAERRVATDRPEPARR